MKLFIIILFFSGILAITVGYINQKHKCPPAKIEYRFIPRTFEQDQNNPVLVSQLFNEMFASPDPWIGDFKISGKAPSNSSINKYFSLIMLLLFM